MFVPGDPRFDEILKLALQATGSGLTEAQRPRWRQLVELFLGELRATNDVPERRQHLRASADLQVHLLAPDDLAGLATTTVGPGGLSLRLHEPPPVGTVLELSIAVEQRPVPLLIQALVVWSSPPRRGAAGELGARFLEVAPADAELLEGIAVSALLARSAVE